MYNTSQEAHVYQQSCKHMIKAGEVANSMYMTDHGYLHALRVHFISSWLGSVFSLTEYEQNLLQASALLHDIGMASAKRETHNEESEKMVLNLCNEKALPFTEEEAIVVSRLCRWHRGKYNKDEVVICENHSLRTGLIATILRLADELDLDYRRSDYTTDEGISFIKNIKEEQVKYHESVRNVLGVRLKLDSLTHHFEIFIDSVPKAMLQIERLIKECLSSYLHFPVKITAVNPDEIPFSSSPVSKNAKIFSYNNPHSILISTLTNMALTEIGVSSEIISGYNFKSPTNPIWEEIQSSVFDNSTHVYFIGLHIDDSCFTILEQIIRSNPTCKFFMACTTLATNNKFSQIRELGINIILGDEHILFCSDIVMANMLTWIKVAGELNLDGHVIRRSNDKKIFLLAQGLKYSIIQCSNKELPISEVIDHISSNNYKYFLEKATQYEMYLSKTRLVYKVNGKVVEVEQSINIHGRFIYDWIVDIITSQKTYPYNKFEFPYPYAVYIQNHAQSRKVRVLYMSYFKNIDQILPVRCFCQNEGENVGTDNTIWKTYDNLADAKKDLEKVVTCINDFYNEFLF